MFTLDVAQKDMRRFQELMNKANISFRIKSTKDDVVTISVKEQGHLDRAKQLVKNIKPTSPI